MDNRDKTTQAIVMNVKILPPTETGNGFIPIRYLPDGKDENYLRYLQNQTPMSAWRHLRSDEVERLVNNGNSAENWDKILVTDPFNPRLIKNSRFYGVVRIGALDNVFLEYHDLRLPAGISNSMIISCDIGDNVAIHDVHYLSHYIIGDNCILFNIDEIQTTNYAKFGNGIVKEGEPEDVRIWVELMNETGCRKIIPFDGIITADAWLWAKYIDDTGLQAGLKKITNNSFDYKRGYFGEIGNQCVIKNSRIIKDVKIGDCCYIKGANKIKNLTINSSQKEPTQIGEGVELVNGIIGYGCRIFYGCKAVRFILGSNSNLKYGARLINSFLGDNSTISCCEVLNNLLFPAHEQHHNNSFLVATVVKGQSNIAAGATIGSNHNSRANDNEIEAGRGFWPGLCTSLKHSSRFASFVLLAKADYPSELDIPLPFSLLNNNVSENRLEVMPAYWWMYNMYALARNTWKYQNRDKRNNKVQNIEFDYLAPDTIEEIIKALKLLEIWVAKAALKADNKYNENTSEDELRKIARSLLKNEKSKVNNLSVFGENMENSKRAVVIIKSFQAYHAYNDMIMYYAVRNLMNYLEQYPDNTFDDMKSILRGERESEWENMGGQIMLKSDLDMLRNDIRNGQLNTWNEIHNRYDVLWEKYHFDKQKHAYAMLCKSLENDNPTSAQWQDALSKGMKIQEYVRDQTYLSRKKDHDNPYRKTTFRNTDEMLAALGTADENRFIIQVSDETELFRKRVNKLIEREN